MAMSLEQAFQQFDADGNGYLTVNEVIGILTMQSGGQPLSMADAQSFVQAFDVDGNGALDYREFCSAMQSMQQQPLMAIGQPMMAMAQPAEQMAQPMSQPQIPCANGMLSLHARVQTQWDEGSGCDFKYYLGNITAILSGTTATITYDDGDVWTGESRWMYLVPENHPAYARQQSVSRGMAIGFSSLQG